MLMFDFILVCVILGFHLEIWMLFVFEHALPFLTVEYAYS